MEYLGLILIFDNCSLLPLCVLVLRLLPSPAGQISGFPFSPFFRPILHSNLGPDRSMLDSALSLFLLYSPFAIEFSRLDLLSMDRRCK